MGLRKISTTQKSILAKASAETSKAGSAVPSAAQLGEVFVAKKFTSTGISPKADVVLSVLKYNEQASVYSSVFSEVDMKVIHCIHDQRPSVFHRFYATLEEYIAERHGTDDEFPDNRSLLEAMLRCRFVWTKGDILDEDRHCLYKAWRSAIYCDGDEAAVKQVLMFVDGFVHWYTTDRNGSKDEFEETVKMQRELPSEFKLDFEDAHAEGEVPEMDCEFSVSYKDKPTAKVTDVHPPCYPARILVATIEAPCKGTVSIVWRGNTRPFRSQFEELGIGGKAMKKNESDKYGQFFRQAHNLSIRSSGERAEEEALFGKKLVMNSPVVVKLRAPPADDDDFQTLITALKKQENCFFVP